MEIKGLTKEKVIAISNIKNEDKCILDYRIKCYEAFSKFDMPNFGPKININFDDIVYYKTDEDKLFNNWNKVSCNIKNEFKNLGVIESEKNLDGIGIQYQSEVIYHNMIEELNSKNVIFTSIEEGFKKYPDIVNKYFSKIVSYNENKFTALNGAVFSGGSFIYIPKNTKLNRPLQSYFRINYDNLGQFERTLIIVDDGSELSYIEGCTAMEYTSSNLHAAVVEIYVGRNSKCKYSTIQNWSNNVYNLVTKRALVDDGGCMEWVDGNIGSGITMKYPCSILKGDYSTGMCITISVAKNNQFQDSGAKMIHIGKNTKSSIISKSIASNGGVSNFRGKVEIKENADNSEAVLKCDSLILDNISKSDTYPLIKCNNNSSNIEHESTVSKITEDKLFYLNSRGIPTDKATELIILGFTSKFKEALPVEYAVELNQLLKNM